MLQFLFMRFLPMISISETRELVAEPEKAESMNAEPSIYGLAAEFASHEELAQGGARGARSRVIAAWMPTRHFRSMACRARSVETHAACRWSCSSAESSAASGGYFMQWYANVVSYPINIGGRPMHSWPLFIPITFELTVLCAALFAFFGSLAHEQVCRSRIIRFSTRRISSALRSTASFCASRPGDAKFDLVATRRFLESLQPLAVSEVPL